MIPLSLTLEPREVNNPDDGKKKTVHVLNLRVNMKLSDLAIAARQQTDQFLLPVSDVEPADDGMRFAPDFDPVAPDTHTPQENIDQLWEGGKPATAKPVEVIPAVKEKPAKTTKEQVDNAAPLTDEDFQPDPPAPPPDPRTVEGTDSWFFVKMEELNILDKGVKEYLFNKMGVPIEDGPVSLTIAMLKEEQRAQLASVFKRKEAQLKKERELATNKPS
jgi:hypothetical protein